MIETRTTYELTPEQMYSEISSEIDVSPGVVEYIAAIRSWCMSKRLSHGKQNIQVKFSVPKKTHKELEEIRKMAMDLGYHIATEASDRTFCIKGFNSSKGYPDVFLNINDGSSNVTVFACGDPDAAKDLTDQLAKYGLVDELSITILQTSPNGVTKSKRYLESSEKRMPLDCFYPQIECGIKEFYDDYLNSDEPILILIGAPGMGKTTLVRGMMYHSGRSGCAVYDSKTVHENLGEIIDIMSEDDMHFAIFEDASDLISSREDGNTIMQTLLNTSDGLTPRGKSKKIIFTTNLPSINNIDDALMRPGRCYGVINFNKFTPEQAEEVALGLGMSDFDKTIKKSHTLAEVIEQAVDRKIGKQVVRRIGF